jgi:hypothetical protein
MTFAKPRPDLASYERATRIALPEAVKETAGLLGPRLVAYIAEVKDTRSVRAWATGANEPRPPIPERLRLALRVALMIADHDDPHVAQAWFQGLNPQLNDRSPAQMLRDGDLGEVGPEIIAAARAFVIGG